LEISPTVMLNFANQSCNHLHAEMLTCFQRLGKSKCQVRIYV
jgi:hypothetical protein